MKKAEITPLTGVRFYAALLVFFSHISIVPNIESLTNGILFFDVGVVGVSFFFVLSGFILTYNYADAFRAGVDRFRYRKFVWDRFTKIYPVHLMMLLFMIPMQVFSPNLPLDWRAVPFHLFLVQCFWPISNPTFHNYLNVPSWSISCEWFFYLLAPFAIFASFFRRKTAVTILLVCLYAASLGFVLWGSTDAFRKIYLVSWFAPSRFPEFLAGILLAQLYFRNTKLLTPARSWLVQILGILLITAGAMYRLHAPWPFWGGLLYVPGSLVLIYGLARGNSGITRHLSHSWVRTLGIASFSFYMIHAPFLRVLRAAFNHFSWSIESWSRFAIFALICWTFTQSVALIVCFRYEIPVQKMLRQRFSGIRS